MSYRLQRVVVCDSAECREAPSVEALITAEENGDFQGWIETSTPEGPRHLCPPCHAKGAVIALSEGNSSKSD